MRYLFISKRLKSFYLNDGDLFSWVLQRFNYADAVKRSLNSPTCNWYRDDKNYVE